MKKGLTRIVKPFFNFVKSLLRFFFRLLYHQFAWTYDLVAAAVSLNRWKKWVMSVIPLIQGNCVLELGHGPGHLQRTLLAGVGQQGTTSGRELRVVGLDESAQMGRLAKRNLTRNFSNQNSAYAQISLTRGLAQRLPFPDESFDTVVATFPTEYFTDPQTLAEVKRCLVTGGRFVVLPVALPRNSFLDWLFKVTHQRPTEALDIIQSRLREPFVTAGFTTEIKVLEVKSGTLVVILGTKP